MERQKQWRQSEKGKAAMRRAQEKYRHSEKGKSASKKYSQKPEVKHRARNNRIIRGDGSEYADHIISGLDRHSEGFEDVDCIAPTRGPVEASACLESKWISRDEALSIIESQRKQRQ